MEIAPDIPDLDTEVRRLLNLHRGQWVVIATIAEVSHSWLSKFSRGRMTNPSYATLKRLHSLLKDSPVPQPQPMASMLLDAKRKPPASEVCTSGAAAPALPPDC